ncbi:MAG: LytTR family DNA-binding domain-containing protein [Qipengyuania sp.]
MKHIGTNGGGKETSGSVPLWRWLILVVPVGVLVQVSINAMSRISDSAALGQPIAPHVVWEIELTSGAAILLLLPAIWFVLGRLRPEGLGWPVTIAGHVAASVVFSLLHVTLMNLMRLGLWGREYISAPTISMWFYEYRKDAWTYALIAMFLALMRWMANDASRSGFAATPGAATLLVQDGTRRHLIPIEQIDYIEAAGNYVEIVTEGERLLHRATLAVMSEELGDSFIRIHRSRIVRNAAIRLTETNRSGDFEVETGNGDRLKGSRRYRNALDQIAD